MASKESLIKEIGNMTVLELADLVKELEEAFGVSAAMPIAAGVAPTAGAAAAPAQEEKSTYKVLLKSGGSDKIKVIKALRAIVSGLSLSDAKTAVEQGDYTVAEAAPKEEAQKMKKELEAAGATVELS